MREVGTREEGRKRDDRESEREEGRKRGERERER